jgi:hypothetical protein
LLARTKISLLLSSPNEKMYPSSGSVLPAVDSQAIGEVLEQLTGFTAEV